MACKNCGFFGVPNGQLCRKCCQEKENLERKSQKNLFEY